MGTSESELILKFKGVEHGHVGCCDIIGGHSFNRLFIPDKDDYSTDIKMFLNTLIYEAKKTLPPFMKEI
jgi:hypothetical protein